MPASADAIKELSVKAVEAAYGHQASLAYEWFCFGGPFWPGMVDAGKLMSSANGTNDQVAAAVNDVTGGLALNLVNFAVQQSATALLGTEAKLVIGALGYTAADLITAGLFIFSPTDIGEDGKPGPPNQAPSPGFRNPFGNATPIQPQDSPANNPEHEQFQNPFGNAVPTGPLQDPVAPTGDPTVDNSGADDEEDQDDHDEPAGPQDPSDVAPDRAPAEDEGDHDEGDHDEGDHDEGDHDEGGDRD